MSIRVHAGDYGYTGPLPTSPLPWWLLGKAIQLFERDKGEAPSIASHKFGCPENGTLRAVKISEAASPVWHTIPAQDALAGKRFCVWRLCKLTPQHQLLLGWLYVSLDGVPYNYLRIAAHAADRVVSWIKSLFGSEKPCRFFRRMAFLPDEICSTGIDKQIAKVTGNPEPFGVPWRQGQPDDGHDFDLAHEGEISQQIIPPPESGQRWTTWEECVDRGWV